MKPFLFVAFIAISFLVFFALKQILDQKKELIQARDNYHRKYDSLSIEQGKLQVSLDSLKVVADSLEANYQREKEVVIKFTDEQTLRYFLKQTAR